MSEPRHRRPRWRAIVEAVLEHVGVGTAALVGHSLGGMVAILLAARLGGNLKAPVNIEGNLVAGDGGLNLTIATKSEADYTVSGHDELLRSLSADADPTAATRLAWIRGVPARAIHTTATSIVRWEDSGAMLDLFLGCGVPRLFLCGDRTQRKAAILRGTGVEISIIPNAGHFLLLDQPDLLAQRIVGFVG